MDSSPYKIAIPSYKRSETINLKTLEYLRGCKKDPKDIYIFVADQEEQKAYGGYTELGYNVIVGVPTLCGQRNFMTDYFEQGDFILYMDDDIEGIYKKIDDKKFEKDFDLDMICYTGFSNCQREGTTLWGIGAVLNAMFMKHKISLDLRHIVGCFYGQINDKDPALKIVLDEKEDYERSILVYNKCKAVVRLNYHAPKTAYYKEKGGMQEYREVGHSTESANELIRRFPNYVRINTARKSEHTEIRLYHNPKNDVPEAQTSLF